MMKKINDYLILSIVWIVFSLLWFFLIKNVSVGILWLSSGVVGLVVVLILKARHNK